MHDSFKQHVDEALWLHPERGWAIQLNCWSPVRVSHLPFTSKREDSSLTLPLIETILFHMQEFTIWGLKFLFNTVRVSGMFGRKSVSVHFAVFWFRSFGKARDFCGRFFFWICYFWISRVTSLSFPNHHTLLFIFILKLLTYMDVFSLFRYEPTYHIPSLFIIALYNIFID